MAGIVPWKTLYDFYTEHIASVLYPLPGTVRVKKFLLARWLRNGEGAYSLEYRGKEIVLPDVWDFEELIEADIIAGYTKYRDVEKGDTVIDIGAYPGDFTVYAAKKAEKVIALEPVQEQAEKVKKAVELNGLDNVEIIEKGVWENEGSKSMESNGVRSNVNEKGAISIETVTFGYLNNFGPDFVKMDIEGAELEALETIGELGDLKPYFAVASYHEREGKKTYHEVERMLEDAGYETKTEFPQHLTTYGIPRI